MRMKFKRKEVKFERFGGWLSESGICVGYHAGVNAIRTAFSPSGGCFRFESSVQINFAAEFDHPGAVFSIFCYCCY